jgi:hypothetical protein
MIKYVYYVLHVVTTIGYMIAPIFDAPLNLKLTLMFTSILMFLYYLDNK